MKRTINNNSIWGYVLSLFIPIVIMSILYIIGGYAPFGDTTRVYQYGDGNYQYYDFYCYLKDIMDGEQTFGYSFNKGLGGNMWAVVSYYLSSPFNLLLFFFKKQQLDSFLGIVFILKYATISLFTYVFFSKRFDNTLKNSKNNMFMVLLAVSFALSYYSLHQTINYMWLDGVYMLPLILLGTYYVVEKESGVLLAAAVGLAIIFNWYIGAINCIFSVTWLFLELFIKAIHKKDSWANRLKNSIPIFVRYAISMVVGIAISSFIFLPTIAALGSGNRGSLDLSLFADVGFTGNIFSSVNGTAIGAHTDEGRVCLYCGSIVMIGFISFFLSKKIYNKMKILALCFFGFFILSFYWKPLFLVFSLFKLATSYWYRYSYGCIFFIVFIAAYYLINEDRSIVGKWDKYVPFVSSIIYVSSLLICTYIIDGNITYNIILTCIAMVIIMVMFSAVIMGKEGIIVSTSLCFLSVFSLVELSYASYVLMEDYKGGSIVEYSAYVTDTEKTIEQIKENDEGKYRISQTYNRIIGFDGITANYNEGLAFDFMPISSYTSSPDDNYRNFMDRVGYRINGENLCVVNTSILAADSFLGVKYLISKYPINGYQIQDVKDDADNIYYNPYALPLAIKYSETNIQIERDSNPFEYQNQLYSKLLGQDVILYRPIEYREERTMNEVTFYLDVPKGNYGVYGNLPWNTEFSGYMQAGDSSASKYACWLSPSVFYIPYNEGDGTSKIKVVSENGIDFVEGAEQFYTLDLGELGRVSDILKKRSADLKKMENGRINISANMEEEGKLLLTVPFDSGWRVFVNGVETVPELYADTFFSFDLKKGDNVIEMSYQIGNLKRGIVISVIAIMALIALSLLEGYRRKKSQKL